MKIGAREGSWGVRAIVTITARFVPIRTIQSMLLMILAFALTSCDAVYGVRRFAVVDSFPSLNCVSGVVGSTPSIASVQYRQDKDGTALTLSGLKPEGLTHTYSYTGGKESHVFGSLQIHQDHRGIVHLNQSYLEVNGVPPQDLIDASRPVMRQIELELSRTCGIPELSTHVTEWCQGVQCGPLP